MSLQCDQLRFTNHNALLEVSSSASCQHILTKSIHSCTYMDTLPLTTFQETVDHDILLAKMHYHGISGLELNWFRSYLNNCKQFCNVNGVSRGALHSSEKRRRFFLNKRILTDFSWILLENKRIFAKGVRDFWSEMPLGVSSEIQDIEIGVPQGSCLGPLLFLLYVNDLPFALKKGHATMYADDTTICYSSDNIDDLNAVVNAELTRLNDWLRGNKLSLSIIKTQTMVIGSKRKTCHNKNLSSVNPTFNVANDNIGLVNETKYLGIMIDDNLKWDSQIKNSQGKVSRALGLLTYAKRYVPLGTLNSMYKCIVEPHFNYC